MEEIQAPPDYSNEHPVKQYCRLMEITQRAFAGQVGLSEGYVSQLVLGVWPCGRVAALKIRDGTGGAVKVGELLEWEKGAEGEGAPA